MKIRVEQIRDKVRDLSAVEEAAAYPALAAAVESGECTFLEPLRIQLTIAREYDHFRAEGMVETRTRLVCSRCLAEYDSDIVSPFTIFYVPYADVTQDEEVELAEKDLISVAFNGDEIDFSDEIAEQVLMEIPFKPLCGEDCKGLCANCGVDLNVGSCNCSQSAMDLRFSVLKTLKTQK